VGTFVANNLFSHNPPPFFFTLDLARFPDEVDVTKDTKIMQDVSEGARWVSQYKYVTLRHAIPSSSRHLFMSHRHLHKYT
jgi:hypothetical protein